MNVKQMIKLLEAMPQTARVHIEVSSEQMSVMAYGHVVGVTQSEPGVVVISNRHRKPLEIL